MTKLNKAQSDKLNSLVKSDGSPNKSAQMRYLSSIGMETKVIYRYLSKLYGSEVRYQFVRNVLNQKTKS